MSHGAMTHVTHDFVRRMALLAFLVGAGGVACSSDDDEGDGGPTVRVTDLTGRTCSIENAAEVDCDEPPAPIDGCPEGSMACYSLGTTGDASGPAAICAGCCSGNNSTSTADDCSEITCADAGDCPSSYGRCVDNECRY